MPQPLTSNPQPKPYRIFSTIHFFSSQTKSRYVSIQESRAFRKASLMILTSEKPGNTPLSGTYLSFLDIKNTHSIWVDTIECMSAPTVRSWKHIHDHFLTISFLSLNGYCATFLYLNIKASRIAFIISILNSFFEISIDLSIFLFFLSDFHKSFLSLSSKSIM